MEFFFGDELMDMLALKCCIQKSKILKPSVPQVGIAEINSIVASLNLGTQHPSARLCRLRTWMFYSIGRFAGIDREPFFVLIISLQEERKASNSSHRLFSTNKQGNVWVAAKVDKGLKD